MKLNELRPPKGARKAPKRVGRGTGSGLGKTSGKGHKGQKARSGVGIKAGREGGQMPLQRRLPKRGFKNLFRKEYSPVNLGRLTEFPDGAVVGPEEMLKAGIARKSAKFIKVLADGEMERSLTIRAHAFSSEARRRIEAAGGHAEVIE